MATFNGKLYDRNFMGKYNNLSSVYADILPNDIKEVMQWSEFIVANVPVVASALEKMSSVSITAFQYMTEDLTEMDSGDINSWKSILEDQLGIMEELKEIAFTYMLYGNVFVSMFMPINRTVTCKTCSQVLNQAMFHTRNKLKPSMEKINGNQYESLVFKGACPKCRAETLFEIKDTTVNDLEAMHLVNWPGQNISLINDNITGRTSFYYKMPNSQRKMIIDGFIDMLFSLPPDIIESAVKNTVVQFDNDKILHLRRKKMNGTNSGWGMPILTSAIPDMISLLLLRKSQERILSDMIFPLRGVVPRSVGNDGNAVYNYMSGDDISNKINSLLAAHKNAPTAIKYFPIPLEVINAFGEGKQLNLSTEIDEASTMVMNSIGVPIEFVKGGLGYTSAGASIRVLENQLMNLTTSMEKVVNFAAKQISYTRQKAPVRVKITPFRIIDDLAEKQTLLQLHSAGKISDNTMATFFKMDSAMEKERLVAEAKDSAKSQMDVQSFSQEISQNLEEKAKTEAMMAQSSTMQINQQAIMQEADAMAAQLAQMDQGQRKSEMDRLQKENWILYAATKERLEFNGRKDATQAANEAQAGAPQ